VGKRALPTRFGSFSAACRAPLLLLALAATVICGVAAAATNATDAKSYPDPVGDQQVEPRCGDIRGLAVSDSRGVISLTVNIKGFKCGQGIVILDTDRDGHWDYDLGFHRNTNTRADIDQFWPIAADDSIGDDASWKILSVWHHGDRYTFRFRAAAVRVKRAFQFEAHLNGIYMSDVVDTAPDYPKDWFTYRLTGG
jgi:hypothetical protein